MEVKDSAPHKNAYQIDHKKMARFFGGVKQEFKNIDWTSKQELAVYTKVVVAATFVFGILLYLVDLVIQGGLLGMNFFWKLFGG